MTHKTDNLQTPTATHTTQHTVTCVCACMCVSAYVCFIYLYYGGENEEDEVGHTQPRGHWFNIKRSHS